MKKILIIDLKRAFKNKIFYCVILAELLFVMAYSWLTLYPAVTETIPYLKQYIGIKVDFLPGALYYWIGFNYSSFRSIIYAVMPILCALPFGTAVYSDGIKHYDSQYFIRTKAENYYISKAVTLFLNGGVVAAFPFAASLYINLMVLPVESANPLTNYDFPLADNLAFSGLFLKNPILYCVVYILWIFISFGFINTLTFVFSFILSNKFVVMISPYVVYFLSFVILEFVPANFFLWNFVRLNQVKADYILPGITQYLLIFLIVSAVIYYIAHCRKDRL
jgi:hypothetical protein